MSMTRRSFVTLPAAAAAPLPRRSGPDYLALVRSHLENLAAHAADRYGPVKTPMWMASLDLKTRAYPEKEPMARAGRRVYRDIASPFGSTIYWDIPQLVACHAVTALTRQPAYAASADAYARAFLRRCVDANGVWEWGNHRYYDAYKDKPAHFAGGPHEMRPIPPAWEIFWRIDRARTEREIRQSARRHMVNAADGAFNRHDQGEGVHAFLEAGGILVESLCWLFSKTKDFALVDQALRIARYSHRHRNPATGLIENNPTVTRWDKHVSTTEIGLWAGSLLRAEEMTGSPAFERLAADGVSAYLRYGWDAATQQYYGQLRVADGTPALAKEPVPGPEEYFPGHYADIWNANFPAHDYPMAMAETCVELYRRTRADAYRIAVERWAGVVERRPAPDWARHGRGAYAELFGRAIHFLVHASDALGQPHYRDQAERVAARARELLFTNGMFRGHAGEDRYDAVDGVGYLLLALLYLQTGRRPDYLGFGF
jgi:hypothetical protein